MPAERGPTARSTANLSPAAPRHHTAGHTPLDHATLKGFEEICDQRDCLCLEQFVIAIPQEPRHPPGT